MNKYVHSQSGSWGPAIHRTWRLDTNSSNSSVTRIVPRSYLGCEVSISTHTREREKEREWDAVEFNWGWWGGRAYWPGIQCRDDVSRARKLLDVVFKTKLQENRFHSYTYTRQYAFPRDSRRILVLPITQIYKMWPESFTCLRYFVKFEWRHKLSLWLCHCVLLL